MAEQSATKRGVTPPKGRPTRPRHATFDRKRVFGATAQWIAVTVLIIMIFAVIFILTDGGDFNPFNDGGRTGSLIGLFTVGLAAT